MPTAGDLTGPTRRALIASGTAGSFKQCPAPVPESPVSESLKQRLQGDLAKARKQQQKEVVLVLGTLLSELRNREIDLGREVDDDEVLQVIGKAIKQRRDAAEQMRSGGRPELAAQEDAQVEILQGYLPAQMTGDEVRALIRELIAAGNDQMGPLMGLVMPRIQGRFDGREASRLVREELNG